MGLLHRPPQTTHGECWQFHEQVLIDERHRTLAYLARERDQILVGLIDSAGTGAMSASFPWTIEGILRVSCWLSSRSGGRGVRLLARSPVEQAQLMSFANKAEVHLGSDDVPWGMIPASSNSPAGIVGAVHAAVKSQGALPALAVRAAAA